MNIDVVNEQIRLYAKLLKIPTFAEYEEVIRQADPSPGLSGLMLELMNGECETRQENQNRRHLKAASFPYLKILGEFYSSQLNTTVTQEFVMDLTLTSS